MKSSSYRCDKCLGPIWDDGSHNCQYKPPELKCDDFSHMYEVQAFYKEVKAKKIINIETLPDGYPKSFRVWYVLNV